MNMEGINRSEMDIKNAKIYMIRYVNIGF